LRKRRKKEEEHENIERWLISYADFITLMFTFFAALYALSTTDTKKMEKFSGSLRQAFKVVEQPVTFYEERTRAVVEDLKKLTADASGMSVKTDLRGIVVTFSDTALFNSGSAEVRQEAVGALDKLAKIINTTTGKITIEGHTDNVPLSGGGKFASNWELSTARAAGMLHYLVSKGSDPNRFSVAGYAEYRPVADNETDEGRAKNRRVEMIISQ
jgi:chemotaxis protein MotB